MRKLIIQTLCAAFGLIREHTVRGQKRGQNHPVDGHIIDDQYAGCMIAHAWFLSGKRWLATC